MKNLILGATALIAINITGCKMGGGDPKNVLISFFDALEKKDMSAARKYATKESQSMLGMIEMGMKMAPDSVMQKDYNINSMEYGDAIIVGNKATVPVKDKKSGETTIFSLKKEDGDWKVAFDKATMMEMGKDKMKGMKNELNSMGESSKKMMKELNKMTDTLKSFIKGDAMK